MLSWSADDKGVNRERKLKLKVTIDFEFFVVILWQKLWYTMQVASSYNKQTTLDQRCIVYITILRLQDQS